MKATVQHSTSRLSTSALWRAGGRTQRNNSTPMRASPSWHLGIWAWPTTRCTSLGTANLAEIPRRGVIRSQRVRNAENQSRRKTDCGGDGHRRDALWFQVNPAMQHTGRVGQLRIHRTQFAVHIVRRSGRTHDATRLPVTSRVTRDTEELKREPGGAFNSSSMRRAVCGWHVVRSPERKWPTSDGEQPTRRASDRTLSPRCAM